MAAGKPRRAKPTRRTKTENSATNDKPNGQQLPKPEAMKPRYIAQLRVLIVIPDRESAEKDQGTLTPLTEAPHCTVIDGNTGKPVSAAEHQNVVSDWQGLTMLFQEECACCNGFKSKRADSDISSAFHDLDDYHAMEEGRSRHHWYERIFGLMKTPDGRIVARMGGALIRRPDIRIEFHEQIDKAPSVTTMLAFSLFNRYGHLHEQHKITGTRIWGDETDRGDIFQITYLQVTTAYRRMGVGKRLLTALSDSVRAKSADPKTLITIAHNDVSDEVIDCYKFRGRAHEAEKNRLETMARYFMRSCGFRRVGTTRFFAISSDENHACHKLPASKDFERVIFEGCASFSRRDIVLRDDVFSEDTEDNETVRKFEEHLAIIGPSKKYWYQTDAVGNTLLHLAAYSGKAACVQWLLDEFPGLATARNGDDQTPLDFCLKSMEDDRVLCGSSNGAVACAEAFFGYPPWYVETVCILRGSDLSPTDVERIGRGCSCGKCTAGFLSARMNHVLLSSAMTLCKMHQEEQAECGDVSSLPKEIHNVLPKDEGTRAELANMIRQFAMCMASSQPPTKFNIQRVINLQQSASTTEDAYGEPSEITRAAADIIFDYAKLTSPLSGDGSLLDPDGLTVYRSLPKCRNDDDFGPVLLHCGFERRKDAKGSQKQKPPPFSRFAFLEPINFKDLDVAEQLDKVLRMPDDERSDLINQAWDSVMARVGGRPPGVYRDD